MLAATVIVAAIVGRSVVRHPQQQESRGSLRASTIPVSSSEVGAEDAVDAVAVADRYVRGALRLWKRTHVSAHASADAAFLTQNAGLDFTRNHTWHAGLGGKNRGKYACGTRLEAAALAGFDYHITQSHVTPTGALTAADWTDAWRLLHADFASGWDAFMANSVTFYTPDLGPFLVRNDETAAPAMRVAYISAVDDKVLYSLLLIVPNSGHMIELVSGTVTDEEMSTFSVGWPESSCGVEANGVGFSVKAMSNAWEKRGGTLSNAAGLPDLLPVKVGVAVSEVDDALAMWHSLDSGATLSSSSAGPQTSVDDDAGGACAYANARMPIGAANGAGTSEASDVDVDIRAVASSGARTASSGAASSVEAWEQYMMDTHATYTGSDNRGFDRWLDNHLGFHQDACAGDACSSDPVELDSFRSPLAAAGVAAVRAHVSAVGSRAGALWTSGFGGQALEIDGNVSEAWSAELDPFDWCSPTSSTLMVGNPTSAPVPSPTATPPAAMLRLYKRTLISSHARSDAALLQAALGIQVLDNYTYYSHKHGRSPAKVECSHRIEMATLDFQLHLYQVS